MSNDDSPRSQSQALDPLPSIPTPEAPPKRRNPVGWILMLLVIVGGGAFGYHIYRESLTKEATDNAQIAGDITPVSSRVRGPVVKVNVRDNDLVSKGQLLFSIDRADYQTKVDHAESALLAAKNSLAQAKIKVSLTRRDTQAQLERGESSVAVSSHQVESAQQSIQVAQAEIGRNVATIAQARAGVSQAEAELKKVQAEAKRLHDDKTRYEQLFAKREVSAQQFEAAATAANQSNAQVEAARQGVNAAQAAVANAQAGLEISRQGVQKAKAVRGEMVAKVGEARGRYKEIEATGTEIDLVKSAVIGAEAEVARAEAGLKQAKLDLSYTNVFAPTDGRVTRKSIEPGQFVEAGSPLLALVEEQDVWVVANFKETQMEKISIGLNATLDVDTFPGIHLQGKVESIQAGTGSVFSLLPPENASGSYVKVVQRIPVKITIAPDEQRKVPLRPGMSVEATVWLP